MSEAKRPLVRSKPCPQCGEEIVFTSRTGPGPLRHPACKREWENAPRRKPASPSKGKWPTHKILRRKLTDHLRAPGYRWCRVCSQLHATADKRWDACPIKATKTRASVRMHSQRRRAAKQTTETEAVYAHRVFERDGWRCQRVGCGKKTSASVPVRHPKRAVLGHVNALAAGGTHTYGNVVCLCHPCNVKDGVNREPIQFVMEVA